MYVIESSEGVTTHWAAAIDEGYDNEPFIDLCISINQKPAKWKVPLARDSREAAAIANMLRHVADRIDRNIKTHAGRELEPFRS